VLQTQSRLASREKNLALTGICGIVNFDGRPTDPEAIRLMLGITAHRSPDGSHHWLGEKAALAHLTLKLAGQALA
jgi:asparagine synthetase B (glutamine-hydrolysing)